MRIRKLSLGEEIAYNEYVIKSELEGILAITLNVDKIINITFGLIRCSLEDYEDEQDFWDFSSENAENTYEVLETRIQYVLESMAMTFCTSKDDFEKIKRNFYNIGYRMENLISFLIWQDVRNYMIEEYQYERSKQNEKI